MNPDLLIKCICAINSKIEVSKSAGPMYYLRYSGTIFGRIDTLLEQVSLYHGFWGFNAFTERKVMHHKFSDPLLITHLKQAINSIWSIDEPI